MKIKGFLQKPVITKEFICKRCYCVFEADNTEFRQADQIEAINGIRFICYCPHCGNLTFIDSNRPG